MITDHEHITDRRLDSRVPLVGIHVLYSPRDEKLVDDLGQRLYESAVIEMSLSGLSFDVTLELELGSLLAVQIHNSAGLALEQLDCIVRWTRPVADNVYRTGVEIVSSVLLSEDTQSTGFDEVQHGERYPSELDIICPACKTATTFRLSGLQTLNNQEVDCIPIYDCGSCGTTRTITGLLSQFRQLRTD